MTTRRPLLMSAPAALDLTRPVVIAGGGIGGLALAVGLVRAGIPCQVYERSPELRAAGAGLSLWANATGALAWLGVLSALQGLGSELRAFHISDERGRLLARLPLPALATPALGLRRSDLQHALWSALPAGIVTTGQGVEGFAALNDRVLVRRQDGTQQEAALLVGADGLHSQVRADLHGPEPLRYAGCVCWRALVRLPLARPPGLFTESVGRGRCFGLMPCGADTYYWFATLNHPAGTAAALAGDRARVLREFAGWHEPVEKIIAATPPEAILCHEFEDRPPRRHWGAGRVTLLGDAAHPMLPNLGQGGCTALEDAVTLAQLLSGGRVELADLRAWERARHRRTATMQIQSRRVGQIGQLAHPWAVALRDTVLRLTPTHINARHLRAQHGWTPEVAIAG